MYTIGEFGEKTGFSKRTLRFYEELGILYPNERNSSGHRLYGLEELAILQRIQSLKFIGYSLQEIKETISNESITLEHFEKTLPIQRKILAHKREEIDQAISAIDHVQNLLDEGFSLNWTSLTSLLHSLEFKEEQREWMEENLQKDMNKPFIDLSEKKHEEINRGWLSIHDEIKQLIDNDVPPNAEIAEEISVKMKNLLVNSLPEGSLNEENLINLNEEFKESEIDDFVAPTFWNKDEEEYLTKLVGKLEEKYNDTE